ncbi:transmembrane protein [Cystoisospora suis]|uniref:Transmembrane protein n=1 Tax=Cystoisospora suis TaxID=483139 RepID=A0A2C6KNZ5_9APIC|nr:transmembrane protein [Cystoisospora suis]
MREDEILKVVFHGAWVACHHNLRQEHSGLLARLISGEKLSTAEEYSLLYRHPRRTPFRFSKKQHNFAEQTIRRFGRDSPSVHMAINGWRGYVYSFLVLTFIFFCLLYIYRTLKRRARRRKSASHQEAAKKSKLSSSSRGVEGVEEGEEREREIFIETGEERGSGAGMSLTSLKSGRNAKASQKQRKTAGRSTPPLTERNEGI